MQFFDILLCCFLFRFSLVNCERKPDISVDYSRNEDTYKWVKEPSGSTESYTKDGYDYIISGNVAGIIFRCSASYPVYWKINLDWKIARMYMYDVYFYTEREFPENDINKTSKYKYSSTLVFNYFYKEIIGNYTCVAANGDKNMQKSIYIYFDEVIDPPYLMYAGKTLEVKANENEITLPCSVYDPDVTVYLLKENIGEVQSNNISRWIHMPLNESISYNPKIGFQMKIKELKNILGYYKCTTNETYDFVHINVRRENFIEEKSTFDEHKLTGKAKYFWNENMTQFYCCSDSDKPPEMRLAYCQNAVVCKTNREIITDLTNNKTLENIFPYYHSSYVEANDSCSVGQMWSDMSSVIICKGDGISLRTELHTIPVFHSNLTNTIAKIKVDSGITRKLFDVATQWDAAPLTKFIYIEYIPRISYLPKKSRNSTSQWKTVKKIYSGDKLSVRCHALDYFFARGSVWAVKMKNGSLNIMRNFTTGLRSYASAEQDYYPRRISNYMTMRIVVTFEMDEIVCLGPVWNSSEWISAHFKLNILESIVPTIEGRELDMLYWTLNDTDMTLHCKATHGIPTPTFTWMKDGKKITNFTEKKTFMITNEKNSSTLHVHFISHQIHGEFVCTASSVAGTTMKTFTVFVTEPRSFGLIAGVSAMFISFLTGLMFLLACKMKKTTTTLENLQTEIRNPK